MQPLERCLILAFLFLLVASAKDKTTYPLHGTVIAMRSESVTYGGGVHTDPFGKTHGGAVHTALVPVFKIRTSELDYEVQGKEALTVGQDLDFRIDKLRLYVQRGSKERRYDIVGEEKR